MAREFMKHGITGAQRSAFAGQFPGYRLIASKTETERKTIPAGTNTVELLDDTGPWHGQFLGQFLSVPEAAAWLRGWLDASE